ncbi:hypothetical protein OPS25_07170 [Alteromonas ponticola]|uniref:ABC transporter permease n=1 Tax=Alteromonas aquimaris TaxID=2998417 RepID=A0ABT3P675_9ALTE|nr:hypothetical protein [Alteromonas aquimaris]MCW8108272.1 hypothetical protein [Alteromonas aquimaris]
MMEVSYKDSIDHVFGLSLVYMILCLGLVSRVFEPKQVHLQLIFSGAAMFIGVMCFVSFRFTTTKESYGYLVVRWLAYFAITLASFLYVYHAFYEAASSRLLFLLVAVVATASFVTSLTIRLLDNKVGLNSAIADGRFKSNGDISFKVQYRPLTVQNLLVNSMFSRLYDNRKSAQLVGLASVLCIPFIHTILGAYIIGTLMTYMLFLAIRMLLNATYDLIFYARLKKDCTTK